MLTNARVISRTATSSTVEVTVTLRTEIREGRSAPKVTLVVGPSHEIGAVIQDPDFASDIHEMLDDQTVLVQEEMDRIAG